MDTPSHMSEGGLGQREEKEEDPGERDIKARVMKHE